MNDQLNNQLAEALKGAQAADNNAPTPRTRTIQIGALCDSLSKQLHGIVSERDADMLDRDNEAITRCHIMGYMPDSVTAKARKKLMAKCQKAVDAHASKKGSQ